MHSRTYIHLFGSPQWYRDDRIGIFFVDVEHFERICIVVSENYPLHLQLFAAGSEAHYHNSTSSVQFQYRHSLTNSSTWPLPLHDIPRTKPERQPLTASGRIGASNTEKSPTRRDFVTRTDVQ